MIALRKQPIFLLNGEVSWQASDSPLSKELHAYNYLFRNNKNWVVTIEGIKNASNYCYFFKKNGSNPAYVSFY